MGIEPHIPVFDKSARNDGSFERADFIYDHEDDSYIRPVGNRLRRSGVSITLVAAELAKVVEPDVTGVGYHSRQRYELQFLESPR